MANANVHTAFDEVLQSAATSAAVGTTMSVGGLSGVCIQVVGTFSATITAQANLDQATWITCQTYNMASGAWGTTITAAGVYWVPLHGIDQFRSNITTYTSGTITVTAKGVVTGSPTPAPALQSTGTLGAVNQGSTPASIANSWTVRVTDLTNVMPTMDAAARRGYMQQNDGTNSIISGSAANVALTTSTNALLSVAPGQWMITHAPTVNVQATISKAAAASTRHVCTAVSFCLTQSATGGTPYTGIVNLRDGATGAGTILGTWSIAVVTAACSNSSFALSGLNVVGTANTAMTLEYTAAGGAQTLESVTLAGYSST